MNQSEHPVGERESKKPKSEDAGHVFGTLLVPYLEDPHEQLTMSLVCKSWYWDAQKSRRKITVNMFYRPDPDLLINRFPSLESVKIVGQPYHELNAFQGEEERRSITPWVEALVDHASRIAEIHVKRMIVNDDDLDLLCRKFGNSIEVLKLKNCWGFTTNGLGIIGETCRRLKTFSLANSTIKGIDGQWLRQLASQNRVLERLNLHLSQLEISFEDLTLLARGSPHLRSVKLDESDVLLLVGFFQAASSLEEFYGGEFKSNSGWLDCPKLPLGLCRLGPHFIQGHEMRILHHFASQLEMLDLKFSLLASGHLCDLLPGCANLESLKVTAIVDDGVLEMLGRHCHKLRRLKVLWGLETGDYESLVTDRGLIALAQGCPLLEQLVVLVDAAGITNSSLILIGESLKRLYELGLSIVDRDGRVVDLCLDNGIRSFLMGCTRIKKLTLFFHRIGTLSDVGLGYLWEYSTNVTWMRLANVGGSDDGLTTLPMGCTRLRRLNIRNSGFDVDQILLKIAKMKSVIYFSMESVDNSVSVYVEVREE